MSSNGENLSLLFSSQTQEIDLAELKIIGEIPSWLSGNFISNGPAKFEVGSTSLNHWFDGLAMLKKFSIHAGKISFQNRFLKSEQYQVAARTGRLNTNEFATYATNSILGRIRYFIETLIKNKPYDNCNVNILSVDKNFIAMTESNAPIEFKLNDLSTIGSFQFLDAIPGQMMSVHPHLCTTTGNIINVNIEIGKSAYYHIYQIAPHSRQCQIIYTYRSDVIFYMHSFSITPNYIILFKSPLELNKFKLFMGIPFNFSLFLAKEKSFSFVIIDRRTGVVQHIETDPFVCLHSINAYENKQEIIIDLICYKPGNPYDDLYLSRLRSGTSLPVSTTKRYVLDIPSKRCRSFILSDAIAEFPRIHYRAIHAKSYQFVYTNVMHPQKLFFNAIQKLNVQTGKSQHWEKAEYYPGEAVFVSHPDNRSEDDGVLISIAFNATDRRSVLIILDARTMQQIAEADLPFHLPFGLHGNFYCNASN